MLKNKKYKRYHFDEKIERYENLFSYLKIFAGLSLTSPLVFAYWSLDFGMLKAFYITVIQYFLLMLLAIPMFNYLQHDQFRYRIKKYSKWA